MLHTLEHNRTYQIKHIFSQLVGSYGRRKPATANNVWLATAG